MEREQDWSGSVAELRDHLARWINDELVEPKGSISRKLLNKKLLSRVKETVLIENWPASYALLHGISQSSANTAQTEEYHLQPVLRAKNPWGRRTLLYASLVVHYFVEDFEEAPPAWPAEQELEAFLIVLEQLLTYVPSANGDHSHAVDSPELNAFSTRNGPQEYHYQQASVTRPTFGESVLADGQTANGIPKREAGLESSNKIGAEVKPRQTTSRGNPSLAASDSRILPPTKPEDSLPIRPNQNQSSAPTSYPRHNVDGSEVDAIVEASVADSSGRASAPSSSLDDSNSPAREPRLQVEEKTAHTVDATQVKELRDNAEIALNREELDALKKCSLTFPEMDRIGDRVLSERDNGFGEFWVIGDIHADIDSIIALWSHIRSESKAPLVFLGDILDRGKYPLETLRFLARRMIAEPNSLYFVLGNHDEFDWDEDKKDFRTEVEPSESIDLINQLLGSVNDSEDIRSDIEVAKFFAKVFQQSPRAILLSDGGFLCHGGVPVYPFKKKPPHPIQIQDLLDAHAAKCFTWARWVDIPEKAYFPGAPIEFGRQNLIDFKMYLGDCGYQLNYLIRGHDHVDSGYVIQTIDDQSSLKICTLVSMAFHLKSGSHPVCLNRRVSLDCEKKNETSLFIHPVILPSR